MLPKMENLPKSPDDPGKGRSKYIMGAMIVGGSAVLLSILASPFLLIPARTKLGRIPWVRNLDSGHYEVVIVEV